MNGLFSFFLTFLAFTPLWLMVVIRDLNSILWGDRQHLVAEWTGLSVIAVFGLIGLIWVCVASRKNFYAGSPNSFKVTLCKEQKTVTVRFVIENVLPMLVFNPTSVEGLALTLTYFLVIASLAVRHRHFPANVVVEWLGWTFYECELMPLQDGENKLKSVVLSRLYFDDTNKTRKLLRINDETLIVES